MHSLPPSCSNMRSTSVPDLRRALLGLALALTVGACGSGTGSGTPVRVAVPPGASFREAVDSLAYRGVVGQPTLFRLYAKLTGRDGQLKAGTYRLQRGASWSHILDVLTAGKGVTHTVTVPEGYSAGAIALLLQRVLEVPADSVAAAVRDTTLLEALDIPVSTLEGYLFPDTYVFADGTDAREAVGTMVRRFRQVWKPEWDDRLQQLAMTRHDIITLASIVEKEARLAEERPVIAAVYHNRLRDGMLLQADPTVQYAMGRVVYQRLFYKDLTIDSPYNTYKYAGLPPGPIASPGEASIVASLYPAQVPYKFFVAHPDGHHEFHVDYASHSRAVQEARRARDRAKAAPRTPQGGAAGRAAPGTRRDSARGRPAPR